MILFFMVQLLILVMEILQMMETKSEYWRDNWNKIDVIFIVVNFAYFARRISCNQDISEEVNMILINVFMIICAFLKLLFFVRVFEDFGQLVQLVSTCVKDIRVFMVFLVSWIVFFSILFSIADLQF